MVPSLEFASRCSSAAAGFLPWSSTWRRPARRPQAPSSGKLVQIPQPHGHATFAKHGVRAHDRRVVALLGESRGEAQGRLVQAIGGAQAALEARQRLVEDVRLAARVRCREGWVLDLLDGRPRRRRRRHVLVVGGWRWQRGDHCTSTELMLVCCPTLVGGCPKLVRWVNAKGTASGLLTAAGWKSGGLVCWQLAGFFESADFASVCQYARAERLCKDCSRSNAPWRQACVKDSQQPQSSRALQTAAFFDQCYTNHMAPLHAADARARQAVALLIICTVVQRWDVLEACYSDEGILPVAAWRTQVGDDALHRLLVVHAWSGTLAWQRILSLLQVGLALCLALNRHPRKSAMLSLWLYASVTARHAKLAFILDRYAHILLLWLCAAPDA